MSNKLIFGYLKGYKNDLYTLEGNGVYAISNNAVAAIVVTKEKVSKLYTRTRTIRGYRIYQPAGEQIKDIDTKFTIKSFLCRGE
jgi:hypothetical protein